MIESTQKEVITNNSALNTKQFGFGPQSSSRSIFKCKKCGRYIMYDGRYGGIESIQWT